MSDEFERLSEMQLDALREVGNVGAGNAATALSQLINKKIDMSVPKVSILPLSQVPDVVGGAEEVVAGVNLKVLGAVKGNIMFLMPLTSAEALIDMLLGGFPRERGMIGEMEESALKEIGNILSGAYLNSLAHFTKLTLLPSIPALAVDMAGAILSEILIILGTVGEFALVIETQFSEDDQRVSGHFFLIPDPGSLEVILRAIGVGG